MVSQSLEKPHIFGLNCFMVEKRECTATFCKMSSFIAFVLPSRSCLYVITPGAVLYFLVLLSHVHCPCIVSEN